MVVSPDDALPQLLCLPLKLSTEIFLGIMTTIIVHSKNWKTLQGALLLCPNVTRVYMTQAFEEDIELADLKDKQW